MAEEQLAQLLGYLKEEGIITNINQRLTTKRSFAESCRQWLSTVSIVATIVGVGITAGLALASYRTKLDAEEQLAQSRRADVHVKLLSTFTELVEAASGISSRSIEGGTAELIAKEFMQDEQNKNCYRTNDCLRRLNKAVRKASEMKLTTADTGTTHAVVAIGELALEHDFLKDFGTSALNNMGNLSEKQKKIAKNYINKLKEK